MKSDKIRRGITIFAALSLFALGVRYSVFSRTEMIFDVLLALFALLLYNHYYDALHQDGWSYGTFVFALLLHNLALYSTMPLGIPFDHYMHFIGGFAIALIADRMFTERWSGAKRFIILFVFALGIGAIGEIVEWIGYSVLGRGEGFFFYGPGDEGDWSNAMLDMIFNMFGAMTLALAARKK